MALFLVIDPAGKIFGLIGSLTKVIEADTECSALRKLGVTGEIQVEPVSWWATLPILWAAKQRSGEVGFAQEEWQQIGLVCRLHED